MLDRQALFDQFLEFLETTPESIDYLADTPEAPQSFDPYQFVGEWIALRHEMKQQGRLLQAAQQQLQQELEAARSQNQQLQHQLEALSKSSSPDQARLFKDLLDLVDALDRASQHWQEQTQTIAQSAPLSLREKAAQSLVSLGQKLSPSPFNGSELIQAMNSDRQGIELIRRNFLGLLKQYQIVPIAALGQPFDPAYMYALGQQTSNAPPNTVIQEVVRGYRWHEQVLREAQVIVSTTKTE
ncbi:nucleotide exchange factor GrpE [Leptolyngbya sp. AN03gr2]|uniref:nucleotide exchange factor GrpE n=1 Tax=unclassified Leptolyngbya TaxID=2650499 RepID=UPI003D3139CA